MDVLVAIDELDDMIHGAGRVPLSGDALLDPDAAKAAVAGLRRTVAADHPGAAGAVRRHLDQLDALLAEARPIPLIRRVRVPAEAMYEVIDRLRAELPEAIYRERLARKRG